MVIVTEDIDVFIICLSVFRQNSIYDVEQPRHIDITKVGQSLGEGTCKALQEWHAYTRRYSQRIEWFGKSQDS